MSSIPDEILRLMARKFRALGDPTRLAVIRALLEGGEQNVTRLVAATEHTQANVSKHLKQLFELGIVGRRKEGLQVFYRLTDPVIEKICRLVCDSVAGDLSRRPDGGGPSGEE